MKKLWSFEVRGTKLENLHTGCENSTVHGCEILHQFMGAKFCTSSWVRIFAPVHGCEFSHYCFWVRNFRTRVQKISSFVSLTSDEHNFFVRTPFEVFLDSMESPLSQESRFMPVEDKWGSKPC